MRRVVVVVIVLVALGLVAYWLGRDESPTPRAPASLAAATVHQAPSPLEPSERRPEPPVYIGGGEHKADPRSRAGELRGVVQDAITGAPIVGAELSFVFAGAAHTTSSGPEGAFTFTAPTAGRYDLVDITAEGYAPFTDDWANAAVSFVAVAGARIDGVVLTLTPESAETRREVFEKLEAEIAGVVVDAAGEPLQGARVVAWAGRHASRRVGLAHSDAEGHFRIAVPKEARRLVVAAELRGYADSDYVETRPNATDLRLVLGEGATVRGRVLAEGAPVSVFMVTLGRDRRTFFDAEGKFELTGVRQGKYDVRAYALGWAPSAALPVVVPEHGEVEVELELSSAGRIFGRVVSSDEEQPVAFARVSTESSYLGSDSPAPVIAEVRTDAAGAFVIGGLGPGLRSITVDAAGFHRRIASGFVVEAHGDVGPVQIALSPVLEGERPRLELVGIGANIERSAQGFVLRRLFDGGAGAAAGLVPGDVIVAIDGVPVESLTLEDGIERLRGEEGSRVFLTIDRDGEERDLMVTRARVRG